MGVRPGRVWQGPPLILTGWWPPAFPLKPVDTLFLVFPMGSSSMHWSDGWLSLREPSTKGGTAVHSG
jgi:hypothetical protein